MIPLQHRVRPTPTSDDEHHAASSPPPLTCALPHRSHAWKDFWTDRLQRVSPRVAGCTPQPVDIGALFVALEGGQSVFGVLAGSERRAAS